MAPDPRASTLRLSGVPPSERRSGHPGVRGRIAGLVGLGAVPTLYLSTHAGWGSQSGGGSVGSSGGFYFTYTLGARSLGTELALTAMAVLLVCSSVLLWRVREPRRVAAAGLIAGATVVASVGLLSAADHHATPSLATVDAIAAGTPQAAVLRLLGDPLVQADTTTTTGSRPPPVCLIYAIGDTGKPAGSPAVTPVPYTDGESVPVGAPRAALCFRRGRLAAKLAA